MKIYSSRRYDQYHPVYMINGWEYGRSYFLSFGLSDSVRQRLYYGETVTKGDNEFYVIAEDGYGHTVENPSEVLDYSEVF